MNTFFKNKFDLVVSIGEDCACTSYLRRCNLQNFSYPFDWLTNAPIENRIDLICNDFKDFLNPEDLEIMQKPTAFKADPKHDYYKNNKNELYFWHDFPNETSFQSSYLKVSEKYQRRIERLYNDIENSQKILFTWLSHTKLHSEDEIQEAYQKLNMKFKNKEIYLLVIENNIENKSVKLKDEHILIINHDTITDDKKHHYDQTMGNKFNNLKVFSKIKLKTSFVGKLKRWLFAFCKLIIGLIPIKKTRQKLKSDLNMLFYHAKL